MRHYQFHIFVCENRRPPGDARGCCAEKGAEAVREAFKDELKKQGLKAVSRANKAGCLDTCELGPAVVIYPEGTWYTVRTPDEARRIVTEHLKGGRIVTELLMDTRRNAGA
jgi:(2Fe-2S) ferredoxin